METGGNSVNFYKGIGVFTTFLKDFGFLLPVSQHRQHGHLKHSLRESSKILHRFWCLSKPIVSYSSSTDGSYSLNESTFFLFKTLQVYLKRLCH